MRVLICDDEQDIRLLYRTAFEREGSVVCLARDGDECVKLADELHPDLVVLDLMMPVRDGFSALTELHDRWPDTHVLVVSAYASAQNVDSARGMGADDCYDKIDFLWRIPSLVARYEPAA